MLTHRNMTFERRIMGVAKRRWLGAAALSVSAALVLGACGSSDDASDSGSDKATIAFVGPLTGESANLGINIRNSVKLAVKEANDKKTGPEIVVKEFDTQGDPAQASTVKDRFVNDKSIIGVVGPTFSGETKAVLPDLQSNNLVMISPSATNVALPGVVPSQTVFHRVIADDDVQGAGLTDYIVKVLKPKKVAYIHDNTDYGKGLAEGTMKSVSAKGIAGTPLDAIDPKAQDFSAAVNKVKASGADLVVYGGYYTEAGRLRKQLVDASVNAKFITGDGALDPGFIKSGGANAEGAQISCPCNLATVDTPGPVGDFAKAYKALNGVDPGTYSTEGYDAANIMIQGIKAGNTTREKLTSYIENVGPYTGISKNIEFLPNGNVKSTEVFFFEVKNGKLAPLGSSATLLK